MDITHGDSNQWQSWVNPAVLLNSSNCWVSSISQSCGSVVEPHTNEISLFVIHTSRDASVGSHPPKHTHSVGWSEHTDKTALFWCYMLTCPLLLSSSDNTGTGRNPTLGCTAFLRESMSATWKQHFQKMGRFPRITRTFIIQRLVNICYLCKNTKLMSFFSAPALLICLTQMVLDGGTWLPQIHSDSDPPPRPCPYIKWKKYTGKTEE